MAGFEVTLALVLVLIVQARLNSELNTQRTKYELSYESELQLDLSKIRVYRAYQDESASKNKDRTDAEILQKHKIDEEEEIADREDHVTQYLSEFLVNTDSEITGLQAEEFDDPSGA